MAQDFHFAPHIDSNDSSHQNVIANIMTCPELAVFEALVSDACVCHVQCFFCYVHRVPSRRDCFASSPIYRQLVCRVTALSKSFRR